MAHETTHLRKSKSTSFLHSSGNSKDRIPSKRPNVPNNRNEKNFSNNSHSNNASPTTSPLKFKSTFPIDQPLGKSPAFKKSPGQRKLYTYPVDEKCCDSSEPCEEHDHYLSENEGSYSPVETVENLKYEKVSNLTIAARIMLIVPATCFRSF
jgi:hypothetical protein